MLDPSDAQNILATFQYLSQSKRLRMRKQLERYNLFFIILVAELVPRCRYP